MSAGRHQIKMIAWTSVLVTFLGVFASISLFTPPKTVKMHDLENRKPVVVAHVDNGRGPASAELAYASVPLDEKNLHQAVDLQLPCDGRSRFGEGVTHVRLTGSACTAKSEILSSEIRNEANGFSATVFYPGKKAFTTDYIALAHGLNKIRILHKLKNGHREEREYSIQRD